MQVALKIWRYDAVKGERALREYEVFYNAYRPHPGIANARPLVPLPESITGPNQLARLNIHRRDRLGGLLHEYEHAA